MNYQDADPVLRSNWVKSQLIRQVREHADPNAIS